MELGESVPRQRHVTVQPISHDDSRQEETKREKGNETKSIDANTPQSPPSATSSLPSFFCFDSNRSSPRSSPHPSPTTSRPSSPKAVVPSSAADLLSMPGVALERLEEMARHAEELARTAWEGCTTAAMCDRLEEMARHAEDLLRTAWDGCTGGEILAARGRARVCAEQIARHASLMRDRARDRAGVIAQQAGEMAHCAEEIARCAWVRGRTLLRHHEMPRWMRDNDFLVGGHRPQLNSFGDCFRSVFSIHTETGNIWTHLIGCVAFIVVAVWFLARPSVEVQWREKAVFSAFFLGAILCLGFSFLFHTVYCHSERVGRLFSKLDYCGIALLIMGSFVPWLYYSFYCRASPQITYLALVIALGILCIIVSMWDRFGEPQFRAVRAGVFVALGLTGIVPCAHYVITDGFYHAVNFAALGWLGLVGSLYVSGAAIYAVRFPECIWPGRFDIWFQSHQIFHVFVVAAAFIHYYGMSQVAYNRLNSDSCNVTTGGCSESDPTFCAA